MRPPRAVFFSRDGQEGLHPYRAMVGHSDKERSLSLGLATADSHSALSSTVRCENSSLYNSDPRKPGTRRRKPVAKNTLTRSGRPSAVDTAQIAAEPHCRRLRP